MVLAIGWAVYLLPKALKRHDDLDQSRPVEEFSDSVRVLGRGAVPAPVVPDVERGQTTAPRTPSRPAPISREAARSAARRRRRVLALLLTTLVAVSVTSYLGYTPWYSTAIPGTLVLAFLVVARLTVRAQQVRRVAPVQPAADVAAPEVDEVAPAATKAEVEPDLAGEDTQGLSRDELAAAVAEPVLDEGGLWDPLPVTLPTYVNKPRARRTVRTIDITAASTGITSSGHDAADSALAAEAAAAEKEAAAEPVPEDRKAAGA
ncbi:hypothetical protein EFK50_11605 [Nocardioides marmoriginsengisoli]|uniref:Uncharacterized protein n=1 Tax=Nocardioides marmoriginsengisoli TaxID=661483 RepID=A0A3N0CG32_9ACTN|nr:hypothetical protein EFK50_11605 [Nocardioides marmoriginsengisoli]